MFFAVMSGIIYDTSQVAFSILVLTFAHYKTSDAILKY